MRRTAHWKGRNAACPPKTGGGGRSGQFIASSKRKKKRKEGRGGHLVRPKRGRKTKNRRGRKKVADGGELGYIIPKKVRNFCREETGYPYFTHKPEEREGLDKRRG